MQRASERRVGRGRRAALHSALVALLMGLHSPPTLRADEPKAGGSDVTKSDEPAAAPAQAQAQKVAEKTGPPPIEISGFVDTYYSYNLNKPGGKDGAQLRNFDTKHNQLSLNLVEIAFEQKPIATSRLGFRADLDFGPATDLVHAAEPGGAEIFKSFEQAYLSYLAPLGKGLQVDVGKFVTQHGAEVIEAKDNWNYSRSLLFALAIPYYHVGLRATYPISDQLALAGTLVNGWNNGVDNNGGKTLGLQAIVKPGAKLTIVQNFMAGPEQADNNKDGRFLSDTTVTLNATPILSVMANYDYGKDRLARAGVSWQGIALYARVQATSWWALSPRFEWLDDGDGFMTGTSQTLKEITLASEQKVSGGLITRLEYRRDFSDQRYFPKSGAKVKDQTTFTVGLVYSFGSRF